MSGGGISERYAVVCGREIRAVKGLDALSGCSGRKADVSCWPDREIFTAEMDVRNLRSCRPDLLRLRLSQVRPSSIVDCGQD
jgi:hypothetical protein